MLQTIEAIYDPKQGLAFSEAIEIRNPVKVLVTFIEPYQAVPIIEKGAAHTLLATLKAHPLPESARLSDVEIDAQIREAAENW